MDTTLGKLYLAELDMEAAATRKCLERVPDGQFSWKPHEKSMTLGNLGTTVADIPRWISSTMEDSVIDFATFERKTPQTAAELVELFDQNMAKTRQVLQQAPDEAFSEMFYLKNQGQELMKMTKQESVSSTINHLVHHRGQLTVYLKLHNVPIPSIYGPSADVPTF